MKAQVSSKLYWIALKSFFARSISEYEAYHQLRVSGRTDENAYSVVQFWITERTNVEVARKKGKE